MMAKKRIHKLAKHVLLSAASILCFSLSGIAWADSSVKTSTVAPALGNVEISADYNLDGQIDKEDLLILLSEFKKKDSFADLNGDKAPDGMDLFVFCRYWESRTNGDAQTPTSTATNVLTLTPTQALQPTFTPTPTFTGTSTATSTFSPTPTVTETATPQLEEHIFSATVNKSIPDDKPSGVYSNITVPSDLHVSEIKVGVWISHDFMTDLVIDLFAPDGRLVRLFDEGRFSVQGVFGEDYWVSGPGDLKDFFGYNAKGKWRLVVRDRIGEDTGVFESWDIRILGGASAMPTVTPTATPLGETYDIMDYFPTAGNPSWNYSTGKLGSVAAQIQNRVKFCGKKMDRLRTTILSQSSDTHFLKENGGLWNYGNSSFSFCSNPLMYGDGSLRGGSSYQWNFETNDIAAWFSLQWSYRGRVTVPAGSYENCLSMELRLEAIDYTSWESISGTYDVSTFAPGVGRISFSIYDQYLNYYDSARLTGTSIQNDIRRDAVAPEHAEKTPQCFLSGDALIHEMSLRLADRNRWPEIKRRIIQK